MSTPCAATTAELAELLNQAEVKVDEALQQCHVERAPEAFRRLQGLRNAIALAETDQVLGLTDET